MLDPSSVSPSWLDDSADAPLRNNPSSLDPSAFPPPLDEATLHDLLHRAACGDRTARNTVIVHNMRLIVHVVTHKALPPMAWDDAIQTGVFGLIRAIDKFNPSRGVRFSTYAVPWIRQAIQRAYEQTGTLIRVPSYQHLAAHSDPSSAAISPSQHAAHDALQDPLSFDHPLTGDADTPLGAILPDPQPSLDEQMILADEVARLRIALQSLPSRLRRILIAYYGLDDHPVLSAQTLARTEGVSTTRIYQLLAEGYSRLRQHPALQEAPSPVPTPPAPYAGVDDPA